MRLRVIQWNISWNCNLDDVAKSLLKTRGQGPAIVCLEEVQFASAYHRLRDALKPDDSCFSLDKRGAGGNEGRDRQLGVAVLAFGLSIVSYELLERTVFPERTVSVVLDGDCGPIRVVAFHSLAGVNFGQVKASNFATVADYLQLHRTEVDFLCFDGNEPNVDSMDIGKILFSPRDVGRVKRMALIMGKEKVHDLTDSYVDYLNSRGETITTDPLTVSHQPGRPGTKRKKRRYDYVMHASRWRVISCDYPYDGSPHAISDHSAVIADFEQLQRSVWMPGSQVDAPQEGHDSLQHVGKGEKGRRLRLVHWNIHAVSNINTVASFIEKRLGRDPTIVCLEGVGSPSYSTLVSLLDPTSKCFSLDKRQPSSNEGDERTVGIAVLSFGMPIASMELVDGAVYPERTLSVVLGDAAGVIRVTAFDSLAGIDIQYRQARQSNYASIADYVGHHSRDLDFLCFDTYEPDQEGSDTQTGRKRTKGPALFLGPRKIHDLSDSYAEYLRDNREPMPERPHTVSHVLHPSGRSHVEEHYDYVMHAHGWRVMNCDYPREESLAAGSEHSAVIADYELK